MQVVINRKRRRRKSFLRRSFRLLLVMLLLVSGSAVALLSYTRMLGPPNLEVSQTTIIYGENGEIIGESHSGQNRFPVELDSISPYVIDATISVEDRRFYDHLGFDPKRIGGAIIANLKSGAKSQGASTITQQYARNLYLTHEKTWTRKWNELLYSLQLEMNLDKDEILEGYLNTVYYGHGAYGVQAAAELYFDKPASELNLAEASMVAGIPKGPTYYSPILNEELAKNRQWVVLQSMVANGAITEIEAAEAFEVELVPTNTRREIGEKIGPFFNDIVEKQLIEENILKPEEWQAGGYKVFTTLDPHMQEIAEKHIANELTDPDLQIGFVAMDPKSGDVKALVGGREYGGKGFDRAVEAKRQPGSTLKPLLYYAALENGYTATTTLKSEKTAFLFPDGDSEKEEDYYWPNNFNGNFADDYITLIQALAYSDNIYAVKTHYSLGFHKLAEIAQKIGMQSTISTTNPSAPLGTSEVTLLDLTTGYSAFANGGQMVEPRFIKRVETMSGKVIHENPVYQEEVLDENLTFILTDMMTAMFDRRLNDYTTVTGGSVAPLLNRPVAGKSGSTEFDSWMIGYTPQIVTGVWSGFDRDKRIDTRNAQVPKQVFAKFINEALKDELILPFHQPDGVVAVEIDPKTGYLASESCPGPARVSYFIPGTEPQETCPKDVEELEEAIEEDSTAERGFLKRFMDWLH
ncbi:penicillin-binding protein 2D [Alkalihalobacillus alcalophilus ATCC 27647 = CGMCC 1.3604]|uniref:Penicillin-binding protein n=1 Tax=Alkalihalobacillus alcalophilus ATCC 27647 = CGMCC 1.3604 TaxID=1218173 RepID=A0A094XB70_ALKAL|nr:PBP1A family penicillin-binding protein [Alkalihalobacillus alcalophilus]KGA96050.1 penicillin-binding protein [Alkalihalobacillus alcalophilus ATCC 27647 = CGMCC 1.3604]MED1561006.1 PBP1A family penicillin-binding protein [Alkalihalobacillus alcalophilus]THG89061.1 penicillin-binding protein 2D [Alkalihalobacillus alcalophilus ATCC 27647 = CGMCC 1.3604]